MVTDAEVRESFVDGAAGEFIGEDFDRWLAEVKAKALREAAIYAPGGPRVSAWLRERADQWEETNRG